MSPARPEGTGPFGDDEGGEAPRRGLRTGWTTGTCASAAAKAAATGLIDGAVPDEVEVGLPSGRRVVFRVAEGAVEDTPGGERRARAVVVKDAGDDPDCTDKARMTAEVTFGARDAPSELRAGPGIGIVTKPGLGLPVGAPAINPVPRQMILAALAEVGAEPLVVVFSVPGGEEMALETTNDRLGIIGGISILGTTGIVRPFSTAAYRASVVQQVDVAAAQGERHLALCTGHRSEAAARRLLGLDPVCLVEIGDFLGIALRRAATRGFARTTVVAMAGKIAKYAAGVMMTHYHRSVVDTALLAEVAREAGATPEVVASATETTTARHFAETCQAAGELAPLVLLCERARERCEAHVGGRLAVEVWMVDFEGAEVLARA